MQTELELLEALIKGHYKTKTAFSEAIKMTRQNLNYLMRQALDNKGILSDEFKLRLKAFDIDLSVFRRQPTKDFVENSSYSVAAESLFAYSKDDTIRNLEKIIALTEEKNKHLEIKLSDCMAQLGEKKKRRSA